MTFCWVLLLLLLSLDRSSGKLPSNDDERLAARDSLQERQSMKAHDSRALSSSHSDASQSDLHDLQSILDPFWQVGTPFLVSDLIQCYLELCASQIRPSLDASLVQDILLQNLDSYLQMGTSSLEPGAGRSDPATCGNPSITSSNPMAWEQDLDAVWTKASLEFERRCLEWRHHWKIRVEEVLGGAASTTLSGCAISATIPSLFDEDAHSWMAKVMAEADAQIDQVRVEFRQSADAICKQHSEARRLSGCFNSISTDNSCLAPESSLAYDSIDPNLDLERSILQTPSSEIPRQAVDNVTVSCQNYVTNPIIEPERRLHESCKGNEIQDPSSPFVDKLSMPIPLDDIDGKPLLDNHFGKEIALETYVNGGDDLLPPDSELSDEISVNNVDDSSPIPALSDSLHRGPEAPKTSRNRRSKARRKGRTQGQSPSAAGPLSTDVDDDQPRTAPASANPTADCSTMPSTKTPELSSTSIMLTSRIAEIRAKILIETFLTLPMVFDEGHHTKLLFDSIGVKMSSSQNPVDAVQRDGSELRQHPLALKGSTSEILMQKLETDLACLIKIAARFVEWSECLFQKDQDRTSTDANIEAVFTYFLLLIVKQVHLKRFYLIEVNAAKGLLHFIDVKHPNLSDQERSDLAAFRVPHLISTLRKTTDAAFFEVFKKIVDVIPPDRLLSVLHETGDCIKGYAKTNTYEKLQRFYMGTSIWNSEPLRHLAEDDDVKASDIDSFEKLSPLNRSFLARIGRLYQKFRSRYNGSFGGSLSKGFIQHICKVRMKPSSVRAVFESYLDVLQTKYVNEFRDEIFSYREFLCAVFEEHMREVRRCSYEGHHPEDSLRDYTGQCLAVGDTIARLYATNVSDLANTYSKWMADDIHEFRSTVKDSVSESCWNATILPTMETLMPTATVDAIRNHLMGCYFPLRRSLIRMMVASESIFNIILLSKRFPDYLNGLLPSLAGSLSSSS